MKFSWFPPAGDGVASGSYVIQYKKPSQSWSEVSSATINAISDGYKHNAAGIEVNVDYTWRIKAIAADGYLDSEWNSSTFRTSYLDNPPVAVNDIESSEIPFGVPEGAVNTGLRRAYCSDRAYWESVCSHSDYSRYRSGGLIHPDMCDLISLCDGGLDSFMRITPVSFWEQKPISLIRWPSTGNDHRRFVWSKQKHTGSKFDPDDVGLELISGYDYLYHLKGSVSVEAIQAADGGGYVWMIWNNPSKAKSSARVKNPDGDRFDEDTVEIELPDEGVHDEVAGDTELKLAYDAACGEGVMSPGCQSFCSSEAGSPAGRCSSGSSARCSYDAAKDVVSWSGCGSCPSGSIADDGTGLCKSCPNGLVSGCAYAFHEVDVNGVTLCQVSPRFETCSGADCDVSGYQFVNDVVHSVPKADCSAPRYCYDADFNLVDCTGFKENSDVVQVSCVTGRRYVYCSNGSYDSGTGTCVGDEQPMITVNECN